MRFLSKNNKAQMGMVVGAIGLFITLVISVLVVYNIDAATGTHTRYGNGADNAYGVLVNSSVNSTEAIEDQMGTFFTVAPIIGIVIVAVVVIAYVQRIGG